MTTNQAQVDPSAGEDRLMLRAQLDEERQIIEEAEKARGPWRSRANADLNEHARVYLPIRNAQLLAVLELHKQETDVHGYQVCGFRYCYDGGPHNDQHEWPCPTVKAIWEAA